MKRITIMSLIFMLLFPTTSLAFNVISVNNSSGVIELPPFYYAPKDEIRIKYTTKDVTNISWDFVEYPSGRTHQKTLSTPAGTWYVASGFTCIGTYDVQIKNSSGSSLATLKIVIEEGDLVSPLCESDGAGEIDDGTGNGGGIGDGGDENGTCYACQFMECAGWKDYMDKVDQIIGKIPPAPNWPDIADEFHDAIVPPLVKDIGDLLGSAPELPPTPPDLPELDDRDFLGSEPEMEEVPGLEGFDKEDITEKAPVIEFEEDDTGGFDLSVDPVNNLPDVLPGGPAGEYMREPNEPDNPYPGAPKETDIDMGGAPIPGDNAGSPPVPGDNTDSPPTPGDNTGSPPVPDGGDYPLSDYKDKP